MTAVGLTLLLCAIVFLISCSALFSGLETALFTLKRHQIQRLQKQYPSLTDFLRIFRENPRRVLNVLLLGDTMVNVPLIVLCLILIWEGPLVTHLPAWLAALAIFAVIVLLCDLIQNSSPFPPPIGFPRSAFSPSRSCCRCSIGSVRSWKTPAMS